ncbi:hypothetical protein [Serratia sp. 2723]|uniref:hypothetical protein n=1 Tax=unclassified Serratia (in: enterobacteria) TaxID=2647522 RepID=UPI003D2288A6
MRLQLINQEARWITISLGTPLVQRLRAGNLRVKRENRVSKGVSAFRQAMTRKRRNGDTDWLSIIDGKWPLLREAFTAWLSPLNIATDGQQKQRLAIFRVRPDKPALMPVPE